MARNTKEPSDEPTGTPESEPAPAATKSRRASTVHIRYRKTKKKKRKYTRGLKDLQKLERGLSKAARRLSRAAAGGVSLYRRRSNKSSRKKRDGAIKDGLENWTRGLGKAVRKSGDGPYDIAKSLNSKRVSRQVRSALRLMIPPIFR